MYNYGAKEEICFNPYRLIYWRLKRKYTQRALAEESGVHFVTIVNLEKGRYNPNLGTLYKIVKTLRAPIYEIIKNNIDGDYESEG